MKRNIEELKDWQDDARRGLKREMERLSEKQQELCGYVQMLDATDELLTEVDDLKEELERKQGEIDDLTAQLEQRDKEIDALRMQLVEVKEQKLKVEEEKADGHSKATEIHNHFEPGSSAQVFNDKVTGKFSKKRRWKRIIKKNKS